MKIEKAVCPFCGASLNIKNVQKSIKCEYCGGSVLLTDENGQIHESSQEQSASDNNKPELFIGFAKKKKMEAA